MNRLIYLKKKFFKEPYKYTSILSCKKKLKMPKKKNPKLIFSNWFHLIVTLKHFSDNFCNIFYIVNSTSFFYIASLSDHRTIFVKAFTVHKILFKFFFFFYTVYKNQNWWYNKETVFLKEVLFFSWILFLPVAVFWLNYCLKNHLLPIVKQFIFITYLFKITML